jgi:uncharacterized protein RhaS with RHS repeats
VGRYISPDLIGLLGGHNEYNYTPNMWKWIDPLGLHIVIAWLDGEPVINPKARKYKTYWRNKKGSKNNDMAENGYGRIGDSENRLMEHLEKTYGKKGLKGKNLVVGSIGSPSKKGWIKRYGPLNPCKYCEPGLQNFATDMEMTVAYYGAENETGTKKKVEKSPKPEDKSTCKLR